MTELARLRNFIQEMTRIVEESSGDEARLFDRGAPLLADLISQDDWLPEAFARPDAKKYRQYLLYCDPQERFSVVSFVWGPGQESPVHDHTVWGMVGVLRGAEVCSEYTIAPNGTDLVPGTEHHMDPGKVDLVSPRVGDIHKVGNALPDAASISIHVYGANIGAVRRHTYDPATGQARPFVSGYSNSVLPNIWDRAAESA